MHISEGILSAPILAGGAVLSVAGCAIGLKKLDYDRIMSVAMFGSAFFVASLIHVPAGIGSVHLLLNGLMGLILGWSAFPAILAALLLQTIFFQYGGLLVLGVNGINIAGPAVLFGFLFRSFILKNPRGLLIGSFCAGFFTMGLSVLGMAFSLWLSDQNFFKTAAVLLIGHLPIMVIEGLVTMVVVRFLAKVQPDILTFSYSVENS